MLIKKNRLPVREIITIGILPSFLKKLFYRIKGYKIGRNVNIGIGSVLIGNNVTIGNNTSIGFMTVIRAREINFGRHIKIGSMVFMDTELIEIDDDSRINENVIVGGIKYPDSSLKIGKRVIIMEYSFINPTRPIKLGDDTGIGGHCLLFTHGSWLSQLDGFPVTFAPITLGKCVWLPWRVFIMPGVEIGDEVVIGANSLISKSLPSNCLAAGSPAKIIKENYPSPLSDTKREEVLENIFREFQEHLEYHNYTYERHSIQNGYNIEIKNPKGSSFKIIYSKIPNPEVDKLEDNLLILDIAEKSTKVNVDKSFKMVLNLSEKSRKGTSEVGEEFVSFVSRFGLRFNRLD